MSDASKDEIILCGCGWTGTREDWHTHNKTDSRHAACQRCAEHTANENQLKADLEAAENAIREMCGASEGSYLSALRDAYFQAKGER